MNPLKTRTLSSALMRKGFHVQEGGDKYYILFVEGRKTTVRTKISHGEREYGVRLLSEMRRQLHLDRNEFAQFVECPMSGAEYVAHLVRAGHLPNDVTRTQ